jgi:hypothetical protein
MSLYAARLIDLLESREKAVAHADTESGSRSFEGGGLTEHDSVVENAGLPERGARRRERRNQYYC